MAKLQSPYGAFEIYDDDNAHKLTELVQSPSSGVLGGCVERDYDANPFGSLGFDTFEAAGIPVIPRSEWPERIKEGNAKKLFALHHHKLKNVPIMNQARTNYCHSEDTEVLTEHGWQAWPDLDQSAALATVNPVSRAIQYQYPTHLHTVEYKGEMMHASHKHLDMAVTPDHRMLVRKWDQSQRDHSSQYEFVLAKDLGWSTGLMGAPEGGWTGTEIKQIEIDGITASGDDLMRLLGLVVSDGFAGNSEKSMGTVSFCCFDETFVAKAREVAAKFLLKEQPTRQGVFAKHNFHKLAEWIRAKCYSGEPSAKTKRIPDLVKVASVRQIEIFLHYFRDKTRGKIEGREFFSASKQLMDDIQELLLKCGRRSRVRSGKKGEDVPYSGNSKGYIKASQIHYCKEYLRNALTLNRKKQVEQDRYSGTVFCATVPNGTLVTRRQGTVLISGNCWINAVVGAMMNTRACVGAHTVNLSSASAGAPGKNYRNVGGWTGEAIKYIRQYGIVPTSLWPNAAIDRSYFQRTREAAKQFNIGNWLELRPKNFDQVMTCLLNGWCVSVGLMWWGHAVYYNCPVEIGRNTFGVVSPNSWGENWENGGMTVLAERKATPDEANVVTNVKLDAWTPEDLVS